MRAWMEILMMRRFKSVFVQEFNIKLLFLGVNDVELKMEVRSVEYYRMLGGENSYFEDM